MRRHLKALGALTVLVGGLTAGSAGLMARSADAAGCGPAVPAGTSCTLNGTVTLTGAR